MPRLPVLVLIATITSPIFTMNRIRSQFARADYVFAPAGGPVLGTEKRVHLTSANLGNALLRWARRRKHLRRPRVVVRAFWVRPGSHTRGCRKSAAHL
jgi:hypothetical protein